MNTYEDGNIQEKQGTIDWTSSKDKDPCKKDCRSNIGEVVGTNSLIPILTLRFLWQLWYFIWLSS